MKIIYPFVEASSDVYSQVPPLLRYTVQSLACDCSAQRRQLAETFHAISSAIPRIDDLICSESLAMPEGIIIQAVYVAIGPFFVVESGIDGKGKEKKDSVVLSTLGSSAMRGLRLDALSLIRSVGAACCIWWTVSNCVTDLCQPRRPAELDYRRDSFFLDQAIRQQTEGWTVPVCYSHSSQNN